MAGGRTDGRDVAKIRPWPPRLFFSLAQVGGCPLSWPHRVPSGNAAHSSGIPAMRRPTKYVDSNRARIFGTPQYPAPARNRAMLA